MAKQILRRDVKFQLKKLERMINCSNNGSCMNMEMTNSICRRMTNRSLNKD